MRQSKEIDLISKAMHAAKAKIGDLTRDTTAHKYKYADLEQVLNTIRPVLNEHGLDMTQGAKVSDDGKFLIVTTTVRLIGTNQWVYEDMPLPTENKSQMNGFQHFGCGMTYGRRYALAAFFNITQKDDDGAAQITLMPTVLDSIVFIRNCFSNDDKLSAFEHFNPLRRETKMSIYANLPEDVCKWMNAILAHK